MPTPLSLYINNYSFPLLSLSLRPSKCQRTHFSLSLDLEKSAPSIVHFLLLPSLFLQSLYGTSTAEAGEWRMTGICTRWSEAAPPPLPPPLLPPPPPPPAVINFNSFQIQLSPEEVRVLKCFTICSSPLSPNYNPWFLETDPSRPSLFLGDYKIYLRRNNRGNNNRNNSRSNLLLVPELELVLIKRRRRAEKCRRLAEAQSSYRVMLEKMIRDAMHQ